MNYTPIAIYIYKQITKSKYVTTPFKCGFRGGGGTGGPDPPGKSQVIWAYIENKQLDPPPPLRKVGPPPPPGKCWTPSGTLKNDIFL